MAKNEEKVEPGDEGPNHPKFYLGDILVADGDDIVYLDGTRVPYTKKKFEEYVKAIKDKGLDLPTVGIATGEKWSG